MQALSQYRSFQVLLGLWPLVQMSPWLSSALAARPDCGEAMALSLVDCALFYLRFQERVQAITALKKHDAV